MRGILFDNKKPRTEWGISINNLVTGLRLESLLNEQEETINQLISEVNSQAIVIKEYQKRTEKLFQENQQLKKNEVKKIKL